MFMGGFNLKNFNHLQVDFLTIFQFLYFPKGKGLSHMQNMMIKHPEFCPDMESFY
jgi:hypothetical protein